MEKNSLKTIIFDQQEKYTWRKHSVIRDKYNELTSNNEITIITGIRRCGKSTLLNYIKHINKENDFYMNFDDDRLSDFQLSDFQLLYELFIELFGQQSVFYFDEIQNIKGWERFVRRLHDYKNKIYITGSNASMLSKELGTHLTGRYIQIELFPFSFSEFLRYKKIKVTQETLFSSKGKAVLTRNYNNYFENGGLPEFIENNDTKYLKSLYESILYRDIMVRNKIVNEKEIKELLFYMVTNATKLFTYNRLTKHTGINSSTTVKQYLSFFEDSYLMFIISKFDYSVQKQMKNPKKCYFIDNAFVKNLSFRFSENRGRYLENLVFIELKRREFEIFYHKEKKECDFILRMGANIVQAIQVTLSMENSTTKSREIEGLYEAMDIYNLSEGIIITEYEEYETKYMDKIINVLPAWKWLLQ